MDDFLALIAGMIGVMYICVGILIGASWPIWALIWVLG